MVKNRIIPVVLLMNGVVVQSKNFRRYQNLGNPVTIVERLSSWASDELIYLDISKESRYDLNRNDLNFSNPSCSLDILKDVARKCIIPLTFGGLIRSVRDARERLHHGADKITLNSQALLDPSIIDKCSNEFGSQAVVISIDVLSNDKNTWEVYTNGGGIPTGKNPVDWAQEAQKRGAGEILINSIDRDGTGKGYDLNLITAISSAVTIPVIALGGAREGEHFAEGLRAGADAVAAANIFSYIENSVYKIKKFLFDNGYNVRKPSFFPS